MGVIGASVFQVFCTVESEQRARDLAGAVVDDRLAACVQIVGPIQSTYRWGEAVESSVEWPLLMKTTEERMRALQDRLVSVHPYEIPEVVAVRIEAGFPRYLDWIASSTS